MTSLTGLLSTTDHGDGTVTVVWRGDSDIVTYERRPVEEALAIVGSIDDRRILPAGGVWTLAKDTP